VIPYYQPPNLKLGPFTLEVFGVFVALGIYLAARINYAQANKQGLDPRPMADYPFWGVIGGVVTGHLVHVLLYHPEELSKSPFQLFKFWDGLSSFGGLLGGVIAAAIYFRRIKIPFSRYSDALALGMAPGWAIARLGCFAVHDHPGVRTDFFLAVNFPGGPRHDLGLYDALWLFAIAAVLFAVNRKGLLRARLLALMALLYGPARFGFDFLRARDLAYVDARYLGLTPAQYGCIAIVGWGVWQMVRKRSAAEVAVPPAKPAARRGKRAAAAR
jgi:phosphatidylglycerol---prolipoprotein diacylglyceryl transferase